MTDLEKLIRHYESIPHKHQYNPFQRIVFYLLNHQRNNGTWGTDDYPIWFEIETTLTLHLLLQLGGNVDTTWPIFDENHDVIKHGSLRRALDWLVNRQHEDGSWGEDIWDTCKILLLFIQIPGFLPAEKKAKGDSLVQKIISENWKTQRQEEWFGTGFLAAVLDLFLAYNEKKMIRRLTRDMIIELDDPDALKISEKASIHPVWHISQAIIALYNAGVKLDAPIMQRCVRWLKDIQNADGSWTTAQKRMVAMYTGRALIALRTIGSESSDAVKSALDYLIRIQELDGRVGDLKSTIVVGLAVAGMNDPRFQVDMVD